MLTQAGQSENMADYNATVERVATPDHALNATTSPPASPSDYTPAPGDVVEFEYRGKMWTGICFKCSSIIALTVDLNVSSGDEAWAYPKEISKVRLVKHLSDIATVHDSWSTAQAIAKAYFAAKKDESPYVVAWSGSRVGLAHRNNLRRMWYVCDCDCHFVNMEMTLDWMEILEPSDIKPEDATKDDLRAIVAKYDMTTGELNIPI